VRYDIVINLEILWVVHGAFIFFSCVVIEVIVSVVIVCLASN